jgi:hypothetical protein
MKKMIAEKRSEKISIMQHDIEVISTDEVLVLDDKTPTPKKKEKDNQVQDRSPSRVKFQDFLGRDYTPVTSEEDAANLEHQNLLQLPKPSIEAVKSVLTSTDDFELNKRTEVTNGSVKDIKEGKFLISASCDDLLLSMKRDAPQQGSVSVQARTVVESLPEEVNVDEDEFQATNHVYEHLDPDVYEQLAEEMGEGWGDYTPSSEGVGKQEDGFIIEQIVESEEDEKEQEANAEHAAEDFSNMLSAMQEALNLPDRDHQEGDEDEDSTFEEEEEDVEVHRVLGTFGPGGDNDLDGVVEGLQLGAEEEEEDDDSLGSSWGEVEDHERLDEGEGEGAEGEAAQYEMVDNNPGLNDDDDDDIPPPEYVNEHDMTVYGVPFPIDTGQRKLEGMNINTEDSAACRMEYIREFLEVALGEEKFIEAYRLLKTVDIVDEDLLLEQMEAIVGTEGLKHMGVFIQLITIEEKFENL